MFPANPFLQLVPARVASAIARVRLEVWQESDYVPTISATPASARHIPLGEAKKARLAPVLDLPHYYGKLWDQRWFFLKLPAGKGKRYLRWDDDSEATLFVGGRAHYGFDVAHRHAPLPDKCRKWRDRRQDRRNGVLRCATGC
jgi:alpha-mannosidase